MARFVLVCFILVENLMVQAVMAHGSNDFELNPPKVMVRTGVEPHGVVGRVADQPAPAESSEGKEESGMVEAPVGIRRLGKHHTDKSVAGGGVIIGGLVTAIFAAVFSYIRVTRKRGGDH